MQLLKQTKISLSPQIEMLFYKALYHYKRPNFQTAKWCCNGPTYCREMPSKDAARMTNSADPDQNAPRSPGHNQTALVGAI